MNMLSIRALSTLLAICSGALISFQASALNTTVVGIRDAQGYFDEYSYRLARRDFSGALSDSGVAVVNNTATLLSDCQDGVCSEVSERALLRDQRTNNPALDLLISFRLTYSEKMGAAMLRRQVGLSASVLDVRSGHLYANWASVPEEFFDSPDCRAECRSENLNRALRNAALTAGNSIAEKLQGIDNKGQFLIEVAGVSDESLEGLEQALLSLKSYQSGDLELRSKLVLPAWLHREAIATYEFRSRLAAGRIQRELQRFVDASDLDDADVVFQSDMNRFRVEKPSSVGQLEIGVLATAGISILLICVFLLRSRGPLTATILFGLSLIVIALSISGFRYKQVESNAAKLERAAEELAEADWWASVARSGTLSSLNEYLDNCVTCQFRAEAEAEINRLEDERELQRKMLTRSVQRALVEMGYASVPTSGEADERTFEAVKNFQQGAALTVDGQIDSTLLRNLSQELTEAQNTLSEQLAYLGYVDHVSESTSEVTAEEIESALMAFRESRGVSSQSFSREQTVNALAQEYQSRKDDNAWKEAQAANSIESYKDYLIKFPQGHHVEQANEAVTSLERDAEDQRQLASYKSQAYPKGILLGVDRTLATIGQELSKAMDVCGIRVVDRDRFAAQVYPLLQARGNLRETVLDNAFFTRLNLNLTLLSPDKARLSGDEFSFTATSRIDKPSSRQKALDQLTEELQRSALCRYMNDR